jgi:hypothetical protein
MTTLTQITYSFDSGPILPELQWREQFVIARTRVTFSRNGRIADSDVNAGSWPVAADSRDLAGLFQQLEAARTARIKRIEPEDQPDGGHTETYTLSYAGGKTFSMMVDPGVVYAGGEAVIGPITAFVQRLKLPEAANSRYRAVP